MHPCVALFLGAGRHFGTTLTQPPLTLPLSLQNISQVRLPPLLVINNPRFSTLNALGLSSLSLLSETDANFERPSPEKIPSCGPSNIYVNIVFFSLPSSSDVVRICRAAGCYQFYRMGPRCTSTFLGAGRTVSNAKRAMGKLLGKLEVVG